MIIIIGAGWYGLYLAHKLQSMNKDYIVYEKETNIFCGASGFNQNRLHLGFHYPRSFHTRSQARKGFHKFKLNFPELTMPVIDNIYAVHKNSIIDFETYKSIFKYEKYDFQVHENLDVNFQGCIATNEEVISSKKAIKFFEDQNLNIEYNSECVLEGKSLYVNGIKKKFDRLFDCSWGSINKRPYYNEEIFTTVLLEAKGEINFGALTIMDGDFYSIYPTDKGKNLYTLTSVKYGVTIDSAEKSADKTWLNFNSEFRDIASQFMPIGFFSSRKMKPKEYSSRRTVDIYSNGNIHHVFAGKIDTIFELDTLL
jgi:hypothetical protein